MVITSGRLTVFFLFVLTLPNLALAQVGFSGRWESTSSDKETYGPERHMLVGGFTVIETSGTVVLAPDGSEPLVYSLAPSGGEITRGGQTYRYLATVSYMTNGGHSVTIKETPVGQPFGTYPHTIYTSLSTAHDDGELTVMMSKPGGGGWVSKIIYRPASPTNRPRTPGSQ
jgi:hypothetical protein